VQLCQKGEVFAGKAIYVPFAYPVYDLTYRQKLRTIIEYIEYAPQVYCIGRTGIFRYQNSDGSIDMGFTLAKQLLSTHIKKHSLFTHAMKGGSY